MVLFVAPTLLDVARESWSNDQGAHGPIVLATGIWLLVRELRSGSVRLQPGNALLSVLLLAPLLVVFCLARITGLLEVEAFAMYGALVAAAYSLWGRAVIKKLWFPIIYLMFIFPPPNTLFAEITQPIKIFISHFSVSVLRACGYQIVNSGVTIQIGEYQMLVAAACAGVNSLISLTALGLFYTYVRHSSNFIYMVFLIIFIIPIAIFANIVRILLLLLITYHFGEAAGQGFFHELAGLTMFATAFTLILAVDRLGASLVSNRAKRQAK